MNEKPEPRDRGLGFSSGFLATPPPAEGHKGPTPQDASRFCLCRGLHASSGPLPRPSHCPALHFPVRAGARKFAPLPVFDLR